LPPVVLDELALTATASPSSRGTQQGPLGLFELAEALGAETYLDLLHASAERKDGQTWVW
jgi:hypothetical protein